jgi:lysophospholipase L1-like esterase
LARFETDVIAFKPQLVLWQLGSNSVLRDGDDTVFEDSLRRGIAGLRAARADVILVDPQYAPRILARESHTRVIKILSSVAAELDVLVFRRFAMMKQWVESGSTPQAALLSPDQLHMSDFGYACIARALAVSSDGAVTAKPREMAIKR